MAKNKKKSSCDRCGTCCTKGGPALHADDLVLLQDNRLRPKHLITIRKGEPVISLAAGKPAPAPSEFVKVKGKNNSWGCIFFADKEAACAIYENRPLECSLLQCWDTTDLESVAGKDLLSRYDIIAPHDPVLPYIRTHEEKCSLAKLALLLAAVGRENLQQPALADLTDLVNTDLAIRAGACKRFNLSLDLELFFFGRPVFTILNQYGITTHEVNGRCRLTVSSTHAAARPRKP